MHPGCFGLSHVTQRELGKGRRILQCQKYHKLYWFSWFLHKISFCQWSIFILFICVSSTVGKLASYSTSGNLAFSVLPADFPAKQVTLLQLPSFAAVFFPGGEWIPMHLFFQIAVRVMGPTMTASTLREVIRERDALRASRAAATQSQSISKIHFPVGVLNVLSIASVQKILILKKNSFDSVPKFWIPPPLKNPILPDFWTRHIIGEFTNERATIRGGEISPHNPV